MIQLNKLDKKVEDSFPEELKKVREFYFSYHNHSNNEEVEKS